MKVLQYLAGYGAILFGVYLVVIGVTLAGLVTLAVGSAFVMMAKLLD